ncbi:hypothetical protein [Marivita sp.]|uniref:hypothetical protein n=1 Tax=Marivita sp. TaxID=2003365 RepID=UPI0026022C8A|nr:hypothetical protein [Marivita sp.]
MRPVGAREVPSPDQAFVIANVDSHTDPLSPPGRFEHNGIAQRPPSVEGVFEALYLVAFGVRDAVFLVERLLQQLVVAEVSEDRFHATRLRGCETDLTRSIADNHAPCRQAWEGVYIQTLRFRCADHFGHIRRGGNVIGIQFEAGVFLEIWFEHPVVRDKRIFHVCRFGAVLRGEILHRADTQSR